VTPPIVVVGGGLAGLAAAYQLRRVAPDHDVVVLEAAAAPGGKAVTSPVAGIPIDAGPDAFLARAPEGLALCQELGLAEELVSPAVRNAAILYEGRLEPLPPGLVLGVPVEAASVRDSALGGPEVVAALAAEPMLPPEPAEVLAVDEPVGAFLRRRLGDAVVDRLVGPLLGGVHAGSADALSIETGTPQLAAARRRGGSFVAALRAQRDAAAAAAAAADPAAPVFYAHPRGMGHLVSALAATLPAGAVRTGVTATGLERRGGSDGPTGRWRVATTHGVVEAAAVVLAVPSYAAALLLEPLAPHVAGGLGELGWASVALVTLAVERDRVGHALDASGFLVPERSGGLLTACSFASSKWAHLGGGAVLLRASAGRFGDERALALDDGALVDALLAELAPVLGLDGPPAEVRVARWDRSLPQFRPGHLERVAAWEADLADGAPGVVLAGASLRGLGIPAVIGSGWRAAQAIDGYLRSI
jgi:protoporphyrinogen/coproporphyrinogen III oxidase